MIVAKLKSTKQYSMIIKAAPRLEGIESYYFARKLKEIASLNAAGMEVLNLGIGSPDLLPDDKIISTLQTQSLDQKNHGYQSYSGIPALRRAICTWYQDWFSVSLDYQTEVLPLMGSKEGIMHICMSFLSAGDEVWVPNPGYPTYATCSKIAGAQVKYYDLTNSNGWLPNLAELGKEDLKKMKILWLNYPHMPTGATISKAHLRELISFAKANEILLVYDNPYNFILNENPISILELEGAKDVCIELSSMSKAYNMAGWRVGYLASNREIVKTILKFKSNMDSGMFKPVQLATIEALKMDQSWFDSLNKVYQERRLIADKLLQHVGCKPANYGAGLFLWAEVEDEELDGERLSDQLLNDYGVFITPGFIFGRQGKNYLRISLCSEIAVFENAIERIKNKV